MKQQLTSEDATNLLPGCVDQRLEGCGARCLCTPRIVLRGLSIGPHVVGVASTDTSRPTSYMLSLVSDEASQRPDIYVLQGRQRIVSCEDADAYEPHDRGSSFPFAAPTL